MTGSLPIQCLFDKDFVAMGTDQLSYLLQNIMTSSVSHMTHDVIAPPTLDIYNLSLNYIGLTINTTMSSQYG